ncbi:MAG: hypothetical protein A3D93_06120 [Acidobacteria bacterium RIFCSPHIGHO2_12_FULL_67_30]|nr:MAG: hypothetical protein A3B65_03185 [Acidobacteria bacterium RIFCSPHIGHO2_02_FULL_67_57]OFV84536.1 MAG: hypothetical protein A2620_08130 [Acidobacteria bacterium RIFCSPHIGHO2_01_FULL_67_28]OFV89157.1 MAG: hypothetical protein A3D93_06120 [Acidobacteria bacterium RIFCSPHIGHO2_12_FULL_67_30]
MSRAMLAAWGLALLATTTLPPAWKNWQYSRVVAVEPTVEPRLVGAVIPPEVYARARPHLADLRLIDDRGTEVPYILRIRQGKESRQWREGRVQDTGFYPGRYTQAVVDVGSRLPLHNCLEVETAEKNFFAWVELAASEDSQDWRIVRERAPIYRFEENGLPGNQKIAYPVTHARYLRLRILDGSRPFAVKTSRVAHEVVEEPERAPLGPRLVPDAAAPAQSRWVADLGAAAVPISEIRFAVEQREFHRPVQVSVSQDGQAWDLAGTGEIYRYQVAPGGPPQERLRVTFPESSGRYWRVAVFNRNDAPLARVGLELYATPRRVVWRQEPGATYRLLYGNSRVKPPEYELARLTDPKALESLFAARLAAEELNPGYLDPQPWTERHPVVLWLALGFAVAVLALLSLQALRKPNPPAPPA